MLWYRVQSTMFVSKYNVVEVKVSNNELFKKSTMILKLYFVSQAHTKKSLLSAQTPQSVYP